MRIVVCDKHQGKDTLLSFLNATICLRKDKLPECIDGYSNRIGNAINEYLYCYFAQELLPEDIEHFEGEGVAVCSVDALADSLNMVIMSEKEFYNSMTEALLLHKHRFLANEWRIVQEKIEALHHKWRL